MDVPSNTRKKQNRLLCQCLSQLFQKCVSAYVNGKNWRGGGLTYFGEYMKKAEKIFEDIYKGRVYLVP